MDIYTSTHTLSRQEISSQTQVQACLSAQGSSVEQMGGRNLKAGTRSWSWTDPSSQRWWLEFAAESIDDESSSRKCLFNVRVSR